MNSKWLALIVVIGLIALFFLTSDHKHTDKPLPTVPQSTPATPQNTASNDWLIETGKRVGPITSRSTLADLQQSFGTANVKESKISGPEGLQTEGALIYPDQPAQKLEITWRQNKKSVEGVFISGTKSKWHTPQDITLGTDLKTLEKLNGGPFTLSGFDWDYGGTVLSWGDNGKLKAPLQKNGHVGLRLGYDEHVPQKALNAVLGDSDFSSANPNMQTVNPSVRQIIVIFP